MDKVAKYISPSAGFTLMELIVALGMLSILTTGVILAINPVEQIRKSNDAKRKADLVSIQKAVELYYQDFGSYPASSADFKIMKNNQVLSWGNPFQPYIAKLPSDPIIGRSYIYYSPASSGGQTYYIYTSLELGNKDPNACNKGNACLSILQGGSGYPGANSCGKTCNFGVSSSNVIP